MARDIKWALKEAEEQGAISKTTVEEETKKKIFSAEQKSNITMFFVSLIILAVAIAIVVALVMLINLVIYSVKMVLSYILLMILPFYSIYRIISTAGASKKGDYDFYTGELVTKTDKGYIVKGLEDQTLSYVGKLKTELQAGSRVNLVRIKDEVELFDL